MRILQIIHDFLPHHAAGSEMYCFYLSQELAREHEVHLFFTEIDHAKPQYHRRQGSYEGLPFHEVIHNHVYRRFEDTYADPRMDAVFGEVLDEVRPEVVHLQHLMNHSINYVGIAHQREIPVVFTLHDYWLTCPNGGQRIRPDRHVCETLELAHCGECVRRFGAGSFLASRVIPAIHRMRARMNRGLLERPRSTRGESARPKGVRRKRVSLAGEEREALVARPGAEIAIPVKAVARTRLHFGVGIVDANMDGNGAAVHLEIRADGRGIWNRTLGANTCPARWIDAEVELPAFEGELELVTETREGCHPGEGDVAWADLRLQEPPDALQQRLAPAKRIYRGMIRLLSLESPRSREARVARRLESVRAVCREVDLFLAPSLFLRDEMIRFGVPAERIVVSDYGMPIELLQPFHRTTSKALRFGYVGTLVPHKGVHVLLEAFRRLQEHMPGVSVELQIHGNPAWYPEYADKLRDLAGDGVRFAGAFKNRDVKRIYSNLDVLVVPSIWWENAPITIHEAILTRTPVITSDFGGMADFVRHGENGLLFRVGDAEDLAAKMGELVENPARLGSLREPVIPMKSIAQDAEEMTRRYQELVTARRGGLVEERKARCGSHPA
jgi:glycosyltransferase involved in cell wall biosynthesis